MKNLKGQLRAMVENAAAPVSPAKAMLRASSSTKKSRQGWHVTTHRLIVVAVAAVIIVVFFVPLPSLSLFNRLTANPAVTSTTGNHSKTLPSVDLSATPAGWVPVAYGDAQISVPAAWSVAYHTIDCAGGFTPGEVLVNPVQGSVVCPMPPSELRTQVTLAPPYDPARPAKDYGPRHIINGITVYGEVSYGAGEYAAPSLGVQLVFEGSLGSRVLHTLTRSPRTLALASGPAPAVPSSWQHVSYDGIALSVPATWSISRTTYAIGIGGGCAATPGVAMGMWDANEVLLNTDKHLAVISCPAGSPQLEIPADGLQIDSGPYQPRFPVRAKCLVLHGLTACPATAYPYSVLVLKVTVPGRSTPVIVSIGLAGNGMIARTILYSLRTETSATQMMTLCQPSELVTRFAGFSGSTVQVGLGTTNVTLDVKNNSQVPCLVGGQPWMAAVSSKGKLIATARAIQADSNGSADVTVTLPPAGQASIWLGDNNLGCAHPATTLRVLLPGSTTPRTLAIEGHINICPGATVWASTLHSSKLPISATYSSKAFPPGKCSPNFFSPAESARLAAHFGGYGCSRAGNGTGWVIVASGMSQTAPTLSGTPGGSMIAVEDCASTDSRCLNSASVHSFADFTVFYPPNPEGFPLEIQTVPGPSLLDLTDPKCGIWIFDTSTLSWYPGTNNTLRDILAGSLPFPSAAPSPVSGAVAISSEPPPEISALCK